jgi:hypothetical protein
MYDGYYVYIEDGDMWLGYSPYPYDEEELVTNLGGVADLLEILVAIRAHQEESK